jgi:hypothetical protein
MNSSVITPIVCSLLLGYFMLFAPYGFMHLVSDILTGLDYGLSWSLTLPEAGLVAVTPWLSWALLGTTGKRSVVNQLGLNLGFLAAIFVFFAFGFLLISMNPNQNPLLPSYVKIQPFVLYWAIWFALGDAFVVIFFLLNKRNRELDNIGQPDKDEPVNGKR